MSSPADPVVVDVAATQNVNTEKVDVLPAHANEPSVLPPGRNEEAVTTEASAPPTTAATDTITVAPTPATADTASPAPDVSGLVVADQKTPVKTPFTEPLPVSQPGECAPLTEI